MQPQQLASTSKKRVNVTYFQGCLQVEITHGYLWIENKFCGKAGTLTAQRLKKI